MLDLDKKVALVTGASRGIGAEVAQMLAKRGADIIVNYRSKESRAEEVGTNIRAMGRRAVIVQADITNENEVREMMQSVGTNFAHLDLLVLNASGGLEKDKPENYAMELNLTSQERLVDLALPHMQVGSRVVFVTSHLAHFHGQKPVYELYESVAASKHAGEQALRARIEELANRGISLVVVSGDLIEGTITPKLMQRSAPGLIEERRKQAGTLPNVEDFASVIVDACASSTLSSGETLFVGSIH
jgi:3-oxoacyl-[acyl-carrier protein] reductase